jgi:hypothetical protein
MPSVIADTVFRHPNIRPFAHDLFAVSAIAIQRGQVVRVGKFEEMRPILGPNTRVIDLPGEVVQPTFHDAHIHLLHLHHGPLHISFAEVQTRDEFEEKLELIVESEPGEWSFGWGLDAVFAKRMLMADPNLIEKVGGTRPVFIRTRDAHGAYLSSEGIRRLDPALWAEVQEHGDHVRPAVGQCGTTMVTDAALGLILRKLPGASAETTIDHLRSRMRDLFSQGIGVAHEAMIKREDLPMLEQFFQENRVEETGRMHGMLHARSGEWSWLRGESPRLGLYDQRLSLATVKVFLDGSLGSGTAWMEPDQPPPAMEPEEMLEIARFCAESGFQLAVHAIGRRAVSVALDIMEQARATDSGGDAPNRPLWRIEHAEFVNPEDIRRAAKVGAVLSVQPLHLPLDQRILVEQYPQHLPVAFPWADFTDEGVLLALGSDAPVTDCDPMRNLMVACGSARRELFGKTDAPLLLHALSRDVALHAHTIGGAVAALGKLGRATLVTGEPGDFVVLDGDPLLCDTQDLDKIEAMETWISGVQAHSLMAEERS